MFGLGGKIETVIGEGAEFKGQLSVQGAVYINGRVEGNVSSDALITLGEKGHVKGNLSAAHVVVAGKLEGNIFAGSKAELLGSALVGGDIRTPRLFVADRAMFEGNCEMIQPDSGTVDFRAASKK